jgi:LysM repeat protein
MDLAFLKKKAGPLTYGEWALVGSAGIAAAVWYRKKYGSSGAATGVDSLGTSGDPATSGILSGTSGSGGSSQYTTTAEWGNAAVTALTQAGVAPGTATQAISDYLAGNFLTPAEQLLVSQAIGLIGSPPGGPIGLITTPGTSTSGSGSNGTVDNTPTGGTVSDTNGSSAGDVAGSTGSSPVAVGGTYVVKSGDNWLTVAARAGVSEEALLAANAARGPSALRIGETLFLPAGAFIAPSSGGTSSGSSGSTGSTAPHIVGSYTVVSGDNWITVASRAGVTESALIGANPSKHGAAMYVGEIISIPSPGHVPAKVTTTKNTTTPAKTTSTQYYTVKSGDNWNTVASKFGESTSALLALNASRGPSALRIGESLRVH